MYENFEHTADLGLRVHSPDIERLFEEAGLGLFAIIVDNLSEVKPQQTVTFELFGKNREYLMFDWLSELLFRFETGKLVLCELDVFLNETGLRATGRGEPLNPSRHRLAHEVKAITYHGLRVVETPEGWLAEVIIDI